MRIAKLGWRNFRNLGTADLPVSPEMNLFIGANGQGKTNLLESIYFLATGKPLRGEPGDLPIHGTETCAVWGAVERDGVRRDLRVEQTAGRKTYFINEKRAPAVEYIRQIAGISIGTPRLGVIRGSAGERRDFLDRGILGLHPDYLRVLRDFRRSLTQKNTLLKRRPGGTAREQIAAWNDRLATVGARIVQARWRYAAALREEIARLEATLLPQGETVALTYRPTGLPDGSDPGFDDRDALAEALRRQMAERSEEEWARRHALVGPHRDECAILLNGRDTRHFASAGQQKNLLYLLKTAKIERYHRRWGEYPLLLVDDISAELDDTRLTRLMQPFLKGHQTFVATTEPLHQRFGGTPFEVVSGTATPLSEVRAG